MLLVFGESWESAMDVVAHEYTHGLIDYRPGFSRGDERGHGFGDNAQAEALEEAFGDILGSLAEAQSTIGLEFLFGDDWIRCGASKVACSMRVLSDPSIKGDHEHFSEFEEPSPEELKDYNEYPDSTIFSFAAAKMIDDSRTAAVSRDQWTKVFGTAIFTVTPEPSFADARDAVIFSARVHGFTTQQLQAVKDAFTAVGIDSGHGYVPPADWQGVTFGGMPLVSEPSQIGVFNRDGSVAVLSVYDSQAERTRIALIDTALGTQFGSTFDVAGVATAQFLEQGDRLLVSAQSESGQTRIAILDSWTARQIGDTITLPGPAQIALVRSDAIAVIEVSDTDTATSRIVLLDTYSGMLVGWPVELPGTITSRNIDIALDRSVFQTVRYSGALGGKPTYELFLVDTFWGDRVGTALQLPGPAHIYTSPDGSTMLVAYSETGTDSYQILTMLTATGELIGVPVSVGDFSFGTEATDVQIHSNGRAVITAGERDLALGTGKTRITVLDINTGSLIGEVYTAPGEAMYTHINDSGTRAVTVRRGQDAAGQDRHWVSVIDLSTGTQVATDVVVPGDYFVRADSFGRLLVVAVGTETDSHLVVVDATNGVQVGPTMTMLGQLDYAAAAAGRLVAVSQSNDGSHHVVVIDGATGRQVGATAVIPPAESTVDVKFNADGTRAVLTRINPGFRNRNLAEVRVIDTRTGALVGAPVVANGFWTGQPAEFTNDGTRVVIAAIGPQGSIFTVIDAGTGQQMSETVVSPPLWAGIHPWQLTADSRYAVVTTVGPGDDGATTSLVNVIDLVSGDPVGEPVAVAGGVMGWLQLDAQSKRATLTTLILDGNNSSRTQLVVIDLATSTQISPFVRA